MASLIPSDFDEPPPEYVTSTEQMDVVSEPEIEKQDPTNKITQMECDSSSEIDPQKGLEFKDKGNVAFKDQRYEDAMELYTQSLRYNPNSAVTLSNRSAVHLQFRDYTKAFEDANQAIRIDETFVKSYFRLGKCHVATGNLVQAKVMFEKALAFEPNNQGTLREMKNCEILLDFQARYEKAYVNSNFRESVYYIGQMLQKGVDSAFLYSKLAEAHCLNGKLDEASGICNDSLRRFTNNSDLIYVKALIEYYRDNLDRAKTLFTMVLRSDPDHNKSLQTFKKLKKIHKMKEEGNAAAKDKQYEAARLCYDEALTIDPFNRICNAKLLCNRALCREKLGNITDAIDDCTGAINLDENYIRAFQRRAKLYQDSNQHDNAVVDYETIMRMEPNQNNKANLTEAKRLQKIAKRKDYYKILAVNRNATEDEIKKAYRKKAVLHHPDKHASDTEARRIAEEQLFKEVGEAYSVLSDPKKRVRYDRGDDLEDIAADIDPTQIFQNIFSMGGGAPGGFTFSFGGGGGGGGGNHGFQSFY